MFKVSIKDDLFLVFVNNEELDSPSVQQEDILVLEGFLDDVKKSKEIKALVFFNKIKTNFCHGLDSKELIKIKTKENLSHWFDVYYRVFKKIRAIKVPKIALIHGECFSFGLDLILSCDIRLASPGAKFAFQNLNAALTTAFFSSQEVSKLIGLKNSLDLVLSARKISAFSAENKGLVDEVCPDSFLFEQMKKYLKKEKKVKRTSSNWGVETTPIGRKLIYKRARALIDEKTKGFYPCYFSALKTIYLCYDKNLSITEELERKFFSASFLTQQSQGVLHLFHGKKTLLEREYDSNLMEQRRSFSVEGGGLSLAKFLEIGTLSRLHFYYYCDKEIKISYVFRKLHRNLTKLVSKKELSNHGVEETLSRIIARTSVPSSILSKFIISFGKKEEHKKTSFKVLEAYYYEHNKNYPILEICAKNPLSEEDRNSLLFLAKEIKIPHLVTTAKCFGFEVLCSYLLEVFRLHFEGNSLQNIKNSLLGFGFSLSPFDALDYVGFSSFLVWLNEQGEKENLEDLYKHIVKIHKEQPKIEDQPLSKEPSLEQVILAYQKKTEHSAPVNKQYPEDKINDRCVLSIINKAASLMHEQVLSSCYDADYSVVASCGFPDFWGGPFKYMETVGLGHVLDLFSSYEKNYGSRFTANKFLIDHKSSCFSL